MKGKSAREKEKKMTRRKSKKEKSHRRLDETEQSPQFMGRALMPYTGFESQCSKIYCSQSINWNVEKIKKLRPIFDWLLKLYSGMTQKLYMNKIVDVC